MAKKDVLVSEVIWLGIGPKGQKTSEAAEEIRLTRHGILGDRHCATAPVSGVRDRAVAEKGTPLTFNPRQITIVSEGENARIAEMVDAENVLPEDLGANLMLPDLPELTRLIRGGSMLHVPRTGVVLRVDGPNEPCKWPGEAIKERLGLEKLAMPFSKAARGQRGLLAWTYIRGRDPVIRLGDVIHIHQA